MKKYDATYVYAFTPLGGEDKAHGNPALVVFGHPTEEEAKLICIKSRVPLNGEMIELPIISFVVPVENKKNEFNIKYRFCNGTPVNVCGHGTLAATKAIVDKYNIKGDTTLKFHLDQSFKENREHPYLEIKTDGKKFIVSFDDVKIQKIDKNHPISQIICSNIKSADINQIYETELQDYILICKDVGDVRGVQIPKEELLKIRDNNKRFRGLMLVAISDKDGYDYETAVFSDGLPGPTYKDPACGSANKEIPLLIKTSNLFPHRFKDNTIEKFKMNYPFRWNETNILGGIQEIEYHHNDGKVYVVGGAKNGSNTIIEIDGEKITFRE